MRHLLVFLIFLPFFSSGNSYVFEAWKSNSKVCKLNFDNLPTKNWDGISEPNLTIQEVSLIFHNWALSNLNAEEKAHAVSFNLASVAAESLKDNYWVYKVKYVVFTNNTPVKNFNRKLAIDLSGNIILPKCGL